MKFFLLLLISLFLLPGCTKKNDIPFDSCTTGCAVFNFRVYTGNDTTTSVNNAYVELNWTSSYTFFGHSTVLLAKGYTDNTGKVHFSIKPPANEFSGGWFTITASGNTGYFTSSRNFYGITKSDTVLTSDLHVPSIAYLNLVLKNFAPQSANDYFGVLLVFFDFGSESSGGQFTSSDPADYPGTFIFGSQKPFASLEFKGETAGNQYTYFTISKIRGGNRVVYVDSIYIAKGETKTYEVDYLK